MDVLLTFVLFVFAFFNILYQSAHAVSIFHIIFCLSRGLSLYSVWYIVAYDILLHIPHISTNFSSSTYKVAHY